MPSLSGVQDVVPGASNWPQARHAAQLSAGQESTQHYTVSLPLQVAIKKVLQDKRFKNRELQIMKMMNHCNVVQLKHCFYSTTEKDEVGHTLGVML